MCLIAIKKTEDARKSVFNPNITLFILPHLPHLPPVSPAPVVFMSFGTTKLPLHWAFSQIPPPVGFHTGGWRRTFGENPSRLVVQKKKQPGMRRLREWALFLNIFFFEIYEADVDRYICHVLHITFKVLCLFMFAHSTL